MPEGDSIRRLAARLDERFGGAPVERSVFRTARLATVDLAGHVLLGAASTGKHLFLRFDDASTLAIHLLMHGRVLVDDPGPEAWRRRFELHFGGPRPGRCVGVDIPRLVRVATRDEARLTAALGPDACGRYDHDVAVLRLEAASDAPLAAALLDQRVVAGLGNIYAVEVPFICGLDPHRLVGTIEGVDAVLAIAVALIRTNATLGPQNTTGRNLERSDQWIKDASTRACPVCGALVARATEEETPWRRRTAWCPSCQAPEHDVPDLERAARLLALHPARRSVDLVSGTLVTSTAQPVQPRRRSGRSPGRRRPPPGR